MSLLHGYGRNFTTHWFKLSQQSAPSGHFLWPTECGWRAWFPLLHSMLVSAGPAYAKRWLMWGLFRGDVLFSSDRASKESACCFTAEAPQGIQTSGRQGLYLFLCQFVFLPSSWHPPLCPHLFLLPGPTQVILYLSHRSFQPTPPILLSAQNHSVWCLAARSCLSSMQSVSQVSQPVCTQSDHTWKPTSANHVGPDVLLQLAKVKPPHSPLADCCCRCLAALQKASLNEPRTCAAALNSRQLKSCKSWVRC